MNPFYIIAVVMFIIGIAPLSGLILFSPGLASEGWVGVVIVSFGLVTLAALVRAALSRRLIWIFVFLQVSLLLLVAYENLSHGALYMGT